MQQHKLNQWGNGQGFRVDKKTIKELHLEIGDEVEYKVENGQLIIIPLREQKLLTEEYLISQLNKHSFDEVDSDLLPEEL